MAAKTGMREKPSWGQPTPVGCESDLPEAASARAEPRPCRSGGTARGREAQSPRLHREAGELQAPQNQLKCHADLWLGYQRPQTSHHVQHIKTTGTGSTSATWPDSKPRPITNLEAWLEHTMTFTGTYVTYTGDCPGRGLQTYPNLAGTFLGGAWPAEVAKRLLRIDHVLTAHFDCFWDTTNEFEVMAPQPVTRRRTKEEEGQKTGCPQGGEEQVPKPKAQRTQHTAGRPLHTGWVPGQPPTSSKSPLAHLLFPPLLPFPAAWRGRHTVTTYRMAETDAQETGRQLHLSRRQKTADRRASFFDIQPVCQMCPTETPGGAHTVNPPYGH